MFLRLLGAVEVAGDEQWVRAGPAKRAAVLAVLGMSPNIAVSQQTLIHRVWGADAPAAVRGTLYAHVARLRKLLEAHPRVALSRGDGDGYRLEAPENEIDVFAMRQALAQAHSLAAVEDYPAAAEKYRQAVELWRDEPLRNVDGAWVGRVRAGLRRERLTGLEGRFDVELRLGCHREVLTELAAEVETHPRSEALGSHLMLALYRCDRQSEALETFQRLDRRLRDEYGLEPGPNLRAMQERVLAQDPELAAPTEAVATAPHRAADNDAVVPRQLPAVSAGFVGREKAFDQLNAASYPSDDLDSSCVIIVSGMAGAGKTALAVRWAHQASERFTDGQLFVDMQGFSPEEPRSAAEVLARFLRALGVKEIPEDTDERVTLYRSLTARQRLLVVLDNVADPAQLRLLLPGHESLLLVTSRGSLSSLVASAGAARVDLDVLSRDAARELLARLLGSVMASQSELDELAVICGRLPLALRIATANITEHGYERVADYLAELPESDRLTGLSVDDDPGMAVRWAFDASYRRLGDIATEVFRSTALLPGGSFGAEVVVALHTDLAPATVTATLRSLSAANLLGHAGQGRYVLHDLLRLYAAERFEAEVDDKPAVRMALYRWYTHKCRAADAVLYPHDTRLHPVEDPTPDFADRAAALAWFDTEYDNIWEIMQRAAADGAASVVWSLADTMTGHLSSIMDLRRWDEVAALGLRMAVLYGDRAAAAAMRYLSGVRAAISVDYDTALRHYSEALVDARAAGDVARESTIVSRMANAAARAGYLDDAITYGQQAVDLAAHISPSAEATASSILGVVCMVRGKLTAAVDNFARALPDSGSHLRSTLGNIAVAYKEIGRLGEATDYAVRSQLMCRETKAWGAVVTVTGILAEIHSMRGEDEEALAQGQAALDLAESEKLDANRPDALTNMALAQLHLDPAAAGELASAAMREVSETAAPMSYDDAQLALAQAQLRQGDWHAARQRAWQACESAQRHGFRNSEGKALTVAAEAELAGEDFSQAATTARLAVDCSRETGNRLFEARGLVVLGRTTSDPDLAQSRLDEAQAIFLECGAREAVV